MAKKSAKSKGYRKSVKKKPFLTKKEIIELIVIVAVIVVGIVLFNLFYDDGFVSASDVQPNDVVSYASRDASRESRSRYAKVATVNDLDGFTRTDPDSDPASSHIFTPDEEIDHISSIRVGGSFLSAEQLASNSLSQWSSLLPAFESTPITDTTVQGHDAYFFSYTSNYYEEPAEEEEPAPDEEAEEPESNVYTQTLNCYVDVDGFSVSFDIQRTGEDDSFYLPEDELEAYLSQYTDAFTVYDRDAK